MNERKRIKQEIAALEIEISALRAESKPIQQQMAKRHAALENARRELDGLSNAMPAISDHAIVRYLERVDGFDLDRVRDEILTKITVSGIRAGAKKIKRDGYTIVVKENTVVTITP